MLRLQRIVQLLLVQLVWGVCAGSAQAESSAFDRSVTLMHVDSGGLMRANVAQEGSDILGWMSADGKAPSYSVVEASEFESIFSERGSGTLAGYTFEIKGKDTPVVFDGFYTLVYSVESPGNGEAYSFYKIPENIYPSPQGPNEDAISALLFRIMYAADPY